MFFCAAANYDMIVFYLMLLSSPNQHGNPPGTLKVGDYYVDKTEISNIHWMEYLHYESREKDSTEMLALLPDTANVWFGVRANRLIPMTMISYEQAMNYCQWRSKMVSKKIGMKVTYRLPTPAEWSQIATTLIERDEKMCSKQIEQSKKKQKRNPQEYFLHPILASENEIYNYFDNVSEMTSEKGVAMGGNNLELFELRENITRTKTYSAPNAYLGFRCIAKFEP